MGTLYLILRIYDDGYTNNAVGQSKQTKHLDQQYPQC